MKIAVDAFMEKSQWFNLEDGQIIQGLVENNNLTTYADTLNTTSLVSNNLLFYPPLEKMH